GERGAALGADLDRDLVGRAADAAAADLHERGDVVDRLAEDLDALLVRALLDHVEGAVDEALGDALLAVAHHAVNELGDDLVFVERIGDRDPLIGLPSAHIAVRYSKGGQATGPEAALKTGVLALRALGAVLRTGLTAIGDAGRVEGAADDVVLHAGQVLDAAAADEHD